MNTKDFMENLVFPKFEEQIVGIFFKFIENDEELYETYKNIHTGHINREISQAIEARYSLKALDNGEIEKNTQSELVKSYTKLRR